MSSRPAIERGDSVVAVAGRVVISYENSKGRRNVWFIIVPVFSFGCIRNHVASHTRIARKIEDPSEFSSFVGRYSSTEDKIICFIGIHAIFTCLDSF